MDYKERQTRREMRTHGTQRAGLVLIGDSDIDIQLKLASMELLNPSLSLARETTINLCPYELRLRELDRECYDSAEGYILEKSLKTPQDIERALKKLEIDTMFKEFR